MTYERDLIDFPCNFDPYKTEYALIFENPISLALWVAYRANHICSGNAIFLLSAGVLQIRKEIMNDPDLLKAENKDKLKHIISIFLLRGSNQDFSFRNHDIDAYFEYVYPYLLGEKVASIKIIDE